MDDFHVGFLAFVGVEAFGEDEDGCRYFFWPQSVGHTFLFTLGL